jgi:hypothetical protein
MRPRRLKISTTIALDGRPTLAIAASTGVAHSQEERRGDEAAGAALDAVPHPPGALADDEAGERAERAHLVHETGLLLACQRLYGGLREEDPHRSRVARHDAARAKARFVGAEVCGLVGRWRGRQGSDAREAAVVPRLPIDKAKKTRHAQWSSTCGGRAAAKPVAMTCGAVRPRTAATPSTTRPRPAAAIAPPASASNKFGPKFDPIDEILVDANAVDASSKRLTQ